MKTIIITGTIASGKSTVLNILEQRFAYHIISADKVYHTLFEQGIFDKECKKAFKTVDRAELRAIVLNDKKAREKLGSITHPKIIDKIKKQINEQPKKNIAIEIPLFDKKNLIEHDVSVFITAPLDDRLVRLTKRGIIKEDALNLIDVQHHFEKLNDCDYTINNDGDEKILEQKIGQILKDLE